SKGCLPVKPAAAEQRSTYTNYHEGCTGWSFGGARRRFRRAVRAAAPSGYLTYIKSARPHAAIDWGSLGRFCHAAQIAHSGSMSGWRRSCPTIRGRGASDDRHGQSHLRGLSGDVAKTGSHILGVDERILQPEIGLRLGGSRRLCAKYRQYEAVVHILSHRDR